MSFRMACRYPAIRSVLRAVICLAAVARIVGVWMGGGKNRKDVWKHECMRTLQLTSIILHNMNYGPFTYRSRHEKSDFITSRVSCNVTGAQSSARLFRPAFQARREMPTKLKSPGAGSRTSIWSSGKIDAIIFSAGLSCALPPSLFCVSCGAGVSGASPR
jgi:hypothetical protein